MAQLLPLNHSGPLLQPEKKKYHFVLAIFFLSFLLFTYFIAKSFLKHNITCLPVLKKCPTLQLEKLDNQP